MARKAEVTEAKETEVKVDSSVEAIVKKVIADDKKLVEVEIPLDRLSNNADYTVAVNGKVWQIARGEKVQVPAFIAKVIEQSMNQDRDTSRLIRKFSDNFTKGN